MKYKFILFLPLIFTFACGEEPKSKPDFEKKFWTPEMKKQHLANLNDSSTWDMEMFQTDLQTIPFLPAEMPIKTGVYPTPNYDLVGEGSFGGVGMHGLSGGIDMEKKIGERTILYNSFFVKSSDVTESFVGEKKDRVFFQILVLTDFVDTTNYTHLHKWMVSRNHPDYIGQGFFKTQNNKIDYLAFLTAEQHAYAIVNMRLFDLSKGRTILIAPQKDGSLRSMQWDAPALSSTEIDAYTDELIREQKVIDFFQYLGNIR
ncbi:MAG: hypothetical protein EP338_09860 [Bacteroidetes bacterium]|nr:MAG: hypothetical protein EP338_09860 [Bacteroidota bacterium]